jgi:hypothetical protein
MKPITRDELLPLGEYETIRPRFRSRVIEAKRTRRVALGDFMSAVFENRDTVLLQIQEMLRAERITTESAILHELHTYNDMIPGPDQLSFTLFIEIAERELRERTLSELAGLETAVALAVGGTRLPAVQKLPEGSRPDRTTAVHYFKVDLGATAADLRQGRAPAALLIEHPRLTLRAELSAALRAQLAEELAS